MSGQRRRTVGTVVSHDMDKTAVVQVERLAKVPRYQKYIRRARKYKAHDEDNRAKVGDKVELAECRPVSKTKAWRVARILES